MRIPQVAVALLASFLLGCQSKQPTEAMIVSTFVNDGQTGDLAGHKANPLVPQRPSPFRFVDMIDRSDIGFIHVSGMTPEKYFPTANGSGAAIFDYDGDGKLDLYFATQTFFPVGSKPGLGNRLYRNLGAGKFADVTDGSGLGFVGFCHGIVVGDIDNDGAPDVFLCNFGSNRLFHNNRDGTFSDISLSAGVDRSGWSSSGAFLDYDNDGDLDLYVSNYGQWVFPDDDKFCFNDSFVLAPGEKPVRLYCGPSSVRTLRHYFYRNNGDLTFTEVADQVGLTRTDGHGFGVVAADLNGDGKIDLYVANDTDPNFLYLNQGDGTFSDVSEASGAAFDGHGLPQAGMGVDAEDFDGDGRSDLFVTNFENEYNTLYRNLGEARFIDETPTLGLVDHMPWIGWGCALADFDNDGWPDIFVTNGHVDDNRRELGEQVDYAQPPLLYRNLAGKRFALATRDVGPYFDADHVGRGAAFGDLDDDGKLDIVVNHKGGRPAILMNATPSAHHWVRFDLVGTKSNRDAIGAQIEVHAGGRVIHRQRKGGGSMESAHDPRVLVGIEATSQVDLVIIRWPSGTITEKSNLKSDTTHRIVEP